MHIELTPFTSVMRLYDDPDGYAKRIPYKAALIVSWENSTDVTLCVAMSERNITPAVWTLAMDTLKKLGVTKVTFERHGVTKTYRI